ncbi:MAG: DNA topoisomerase IV subunit B, partial [Canibacter sp.]
EGRVYSAVPPLHRVIVKNAGRKPNDVVYTYSEAELHDFLAKLSKRGKTYVEPIQRYKGLGEMDADQLAETTMDREHRTLRRVRMQDAQQAATTFELLMGGEVAPRKEFLAENASDLDRERIDA